MVAVSLGLLLASAATGTVSVAQEDEGGWPREIEADGHRIIICQPQVETLTGDALKSRAAVSVALAGKTEPVFGTVWITTRTLTDRDTREVTLTGVAVPQVRFPNAEPEHERQIAALLEREVPTGDLTLSLDRLLAALDLAERERLASEGFGNDPPRLLVVDKPTVLATIDGDPKLQEIENTPFENVVNTAFVIVHDPKSEMYYLSAGAGAWYTSRAVLGPWAVAKTVPKEIAGLVEEEEPAEPEEGPGEGPTTPPAIVVATEVADGIQKTPASNPNCNVKYVHVYDVTPEVVYVGPRPRTDPTTSRRTARATCTSGHRAAPGRTAPGPPRPTPARSTERNSHASAERPAPRATTTAAGAALAAEAVGSHSDGLHRRACDEGSLRGA